MLLVIIGGNQSVNLAVEEHLSEHFGFDLHIIRPDTELTETDQKNLNRAGCVIIDLTTSISNSRLFIREIQQLSPKSGVIVLHIYRDKALIEPLINAGAKGYLLIDAVNTRLKEAVGKVLSGEKYVVVDNE